MVWVIDKTVAMREAQARAVASRSPADIKAAKRVGLVVDAAIDRLLSLDSEHELF